MLNLDDRLIKDVSPIIRPNALSVLLAIAIHLNKKTGRSFPSHKRLMKLTGLGRDAVYAALDVLKNNSLLVSEQSIDIATGKFGKREFRVTTRFIKIFIDAEDADPLTENPEADEPDTDYPDTDYPDTDNQETKPISTEKRLNNSEQLNTPKQPNNKNFSAAIAPGPQDLNEKGISQVNDGDNGTASPGGGGRGTRGAGRSGGAARLRISDGEENAGTSSWTKRAATIFDEVHAEQCKEEQIPCQPFNWKVRQEENFKQLKYLRDRAIIPDYKNKFQHEPNDEEIDLTFKAFFKLAWMYFRKIQKDTKGALHYTPTSVYKSYNAIKTFKQNGNISITGDYQEPTGTVFGQGINHYSK